MKYIKPLIGLVLFALLAVPTLSASTEVSVKSIYETGENIIGTEIQFEGLLIGVCSHGGKKGFFKSEDGNSPTLRVEIVSGSPFERMDVGSILLVTGTLEELRIDEKYLNDWEIEISHAHNDHESSKTYCEGACATGKAETPELKRINNMRKQLEESGEDYLSVIWVNASHWEVVDEK